MAQETVASLREKGWEVEVLHIRGGETKVTVIPREPTCHALGVAYCSVRDPYNKKIGVAIALGRALKTLQQELGVTP